MAVGICQVPSLRFCVLIRGFDNHSLESKKSKIINITTGGNGFSIIAPPVKFKRSFQWSRLTEDNIERGGEGGWRPRDYKCAGVPNCSATLPPPLKPPFTATPILLHYRFVI